MADKNAEDPSAKVRAVFGDTIDVKPLVAEIKDTDSDADIVDTITRICYFYPQYTLETAERLTNAQANALLLQAEKQRAVDMYNYTLIAAAPHTKNGKLVDKLTKQYRKIAEL